MSPLRGFYLIEFYSAIIMTSLRDLWHAEFKIQKPQRGEMIIEINVSRQFKPRRGDINPNEHVTPSGFLIYRILFCYNHDIPPGFIACGFYKTAKR